VINVIHGTAAVAAVLAAAVAASEAVTPLYTTQAVAVFDQGAQPNSIYRGVMTRSVCPRSKVDSSSEAL
jgi:hypothetical protein